MIFFSPSGSLNVSTDSSELPESGDGNNISSGAMTRCMNLMLTENGKAKTRHGSAILNGTAINQFILWMEEQGGNRYTFTTAHIYKNETSIYSAVTSTSWAAIKYNAYNESVQSIFALGSNQKKAIRNDTVYEWGIDAPTIPPTITAGFGAGLTGAYNARYTYARKVGDTVVCESNPSPPAANSVTLSDQSLSISAVEPSDSQVTHIRLYRTLANGELYYHLEDIPIGGWDYGYAYSWEETDEYIAGEGYQFTQDASLNTVVRIHDREIYGLGSLAASYKLNANGTAYYSDAFSINAAIDGEWLYSGSASDYECRATLVSGSLSGSSSATGSWLALSTTREWIENADSSVLFIEIRLASTQEVVTSATINLAVTAIP